MSWRMPECPTCGSVVDNVEIQGEDVAFVRSYVYQVTVLEDPARYTLEPCRHEVRGYAQDYTGSVVEWRS